MEEKDFLSDDLKSKFKKLADYEFEIKNRGAWLA